MATTSKILGKSKPAAGLDTEIYTVPVATQAQANLFICNQTNAAETYRVALIESGGALSDDDYLVYDDSLPANYSRVLTGIALNTGEKISVRSTAGNISFVATGLEIT